MSFSQLEKEVEQGLLGRNEGIPMGFYRVNKYIGIRKRIMTLIFGATGCLSGDTVINILHGTNRHCSRKYSLEELYYKFNCLGVPESIKKQKKKTGRRWSGKHSTKAICYQHDRDILTFNNVMNVVQSGIKETFVLKTAKGKEIRATKDHKFLVSLPSVYKSLSDLSVGDTVYVRCNKSSKGRKSRPYRYNIITAMPYYPSATSKKTVTKGVEYNYQRISRTRAVYDAWLNRVSLDYFIEQVKTNPNHGFIFSDTKMDIHHIDGVYYNDVPDNLLLITKEEHSRLHGKDGHSAHFGDRSIEKDEIVLIEKWGEEMTYDIEMSSPYNNFEANGIIVHNSGKSAFMHSAYILHPYDYLLEHKSGIKFKVILFSMERSKVYILAKWVSRRIFLTQGVLIPIPKLLGWWSDDKLTHDEHDLFMQCKDYIDGLLDVVDIVEGPQNPTGIYKYVKEYATTHGKFEEVDEYTKVYLPDHPNEIVIIGEDHLGLTKTEKGMTTKKEAIDKLSEYNQWFRDALGYTPVLVSQLNRSLNNPAFMKREAFEPTIDDIKESGNPGEASDVVISLFDPIRYRTQDDSYKVGNFVDPSTGGNYFRSVKILKNSYGEDSVKIGMAFHGATGIFKELPKSKYMDGFDYNSLFTGEYFLL